MNDSKKELLTTSDREKIVAQLMQLITSTDRRVALRAIEKLILLDSKNQKR
jgi:hypothetical protein